MDVTFICLANSYKHGNRCIAGVEIDHCPESHTCSVKRVNGSDQFIGLRKVVQFRMMKHWE